MIGLYFFAFLYSLISAILFTIKIEFSFFKNKERLHSALKIILLLMVFLFFLSCHFLKISYYMEFLITLIIFTVLEPLVFFIASQLLKKDNWWMLVYIPVSIFFFYGLSLTNAPSYKGALAGFGPPIEWIAVLLVIILYPILLFSLCMLKFSKRIIGTMIIIKSIGSILFGITISFEKEGILAEHSLGVILFLFGAVIILIGATYIIKNRKICKSLIPIYFN
jgi:hypothetical protein